MEFRILGPLELVDGNRVIALSGARQRALLAVLLLNANRVVSADRLLEALWGDEAPESGATALQVRVSQLRKALGKASSVLVTQSPGYALRVQRDELDLYRFEQLVQESDGAEPAVTAEKLREALALWRGPALADFAYEEFAQAAIARLEELRLAALERRIEADLALGRHSLLVGELEELVAEHPLRERLRGQLMLALYRSGRQADALDVYQRTRSALVEELGIEPSPALQELERAILRQEAGLEVARSDAPERAILVAPLRLDRLDALLALAEPLARRPPRELILAHAVTTAGELAPASAALTERREELVGRGSSVRAAAFTSSSPARDAARMALEQNVDLVLLDAPAAPLEDPVVAELFESAPCDVAAFLGTVSEPGPILVPFAGAEHDWSAVELGAWLAGGWGTSLRLAGPSSGAGRDASRLLASASLAVQRALGVMAEPLLLERGADQLAAAAAEAAVTVIGLSERWRREGLGSVRASVAASGRPTLVVRRGLRPGGLAPKAALTRFTWSLGVSASSG